MKKLCSFFLYAVCMSAGIQAQTYNQMDPDGNITQRNESGNTGYFNPNKRDSLGNKNQEVPVGIKTWRVDRRFGEVIPTAPDTLPHLFQNTIYNTGKYGEYNTTGNNYTARQSRIFTDRPQTSEFFFTDAYSFSNMEPDKFLYLNTLSPYTTINYDQCGDKQHGEDHIEGKFGVNVNKRLGFGFDLDYLYALGYYDNQSTSHFRASLYGTYIGDRYQLHVLGSTYHRKATENGGIINDNYITHPESEESQFTDEEIPTVLSSNWNRNDSRHLFLSHRYNIGFYRKVKMTDEEIKARQFAQKSAKENEGRKKGKDGKLTPGNKDDRKTATNRPSGRPKDAIIAGDEPALGKPTLDTDTTRIKVNSQEVLDSLKRAEQAKAIQDSIDATMKREFVPVTSIIHTVDVNYHKRVYQAYETPDDYYNDTFYDKDSDEAYAGDSIYDKTKFMSVKNTVALALLEGFNKYMKAGLKGFVSYEYRKYQMPDLQGDSTAYYLNKWTGHCLNVGGQLSRTQGKAFHFNLVAEVGITGYQSGSLAVDFNTDLNFPLFGDTVRLAANAYFHRTSPSFFQNQYHSKHLWWDQELSKETRTHIEGIFKYDKTDTRLRIAVDEIQNYTYFGMNYGLGDDLHRQELTGGVYQESGNINVLTAQLMQNFRLGPLNWENVVTYQNSSNKDVLPLPSLNLFSNLFLKFKIARVLGVELGACLTYFTKYYAPDFLPQLNQFAIQQNEDSRVELGGYPFVDVYANMCLKRTRFFVSYSHVNAGSGTRNMFLTPHYPVNNSILRFGVSWNFIN